MRELVDAVPTAHRSDYGHNAKNLESPEHEGTNHADEVADGCTPFNDMALASARKRPNLVRHARGHKPTKYGDMQGKRDCDTLNSRRKTC